MAEDMLACFKVYDYIFETNEYSIIFNTDRDFKIYVYVDASYNTYPDGSSHFGYSISLGKDNAAFYAKSGKMKRIAESSTESEYVAVSYVVNKILYFRRLMKGLNLEQTSSNIIFEDNKSTINYLIRDELNHNTTKHINPRFHKCRQLIKEGIISMEYCPSEKMIADILTKGKLTEKLRDYLTRKILNYHIRN